MKSLRPISLSFWLGASLLTPLLAKSEAVESTASLTKEHALSAYAGIAPLTFSDQARREILQTEVAPGVGILVGFIDPQGPAIGQLEVNDVITHFDDQVLVNADQFRTLVLMHKPDDVVKLTVVRGKELKTLDFKLGAKKAATTAVQTPKPGGSSSAKVSPPQSTDEESFSPGVRVTINGQTFDLGAAPVWTHPGMPPEIARQFEEMCRRSEELRRRALMGPSADLIEEEKPAKVLPAPQAQSKSFSFQWGSSDGASLTSSSVASDSQGSVSLQQTKGKKYAVIKDAAGKILFEGDVTTEESRAKMSDFLRERLKLVETGNFTIRSSGENVPAENSTPPPRDPKEGA